VIDPCGHRGIISSTEHMRRLFDSETVYGVMGGFHTGHPGTSANRIDNTARSLAEYAPQLIAPMHCSGFPLRRAIAEAAPDAFGAHHRRVRHHDRQRSRADPGTARQGDR
jgi:7,8-dihydropterin-6-yl-methyl-4-(beta-D-ribofuranosyl)aminobenzene 5'-phosphate synthase